MSKKRALILVFAATLVATAVGLLGLAALGVGRPILGLGFIVPLIVGCDTISRVVMHYGASSERNDR